MDRMLQMIVNMVMRTLMRQGVNAAMKKGGEMWDKRQSRKAAPDTLDQDPAVTDRRERHEDERRGDEIIYPTDKMTEHMQPRK